MNKLNIHLTWGLISLQGVLLLVDSETRNHFFKTFASFNSVSIPLLQSISENLRYIVSLLLIPTVIYPQRWIPLKFASLVAYVFFICLHSNLIFYHELSDVKSLFIQLLILGKALMILVDDMIEAEKPVREPASPKKVSASPAKVSQENPSQSKIGEPSKPTNVSNPKPEDIKTKKKK